MKVSVCMPYYNREKEVVRGVASVIEHNPELDLSFSIACDRSRPPLAIECFPEEHRDLIRLGWIMGEPEPRNPCKPINLSVYRAIMHQKPDVIALTGPEITHINPVLTMMVAAISVSEAKFPYVTARCEDERGCIAGAEVDYNADGRLPVPEGAHFHFLAAFTPALWVEAKGFDEAYRFGQACDDNDWLWRCHRAGATFYHINETVLHEKSTTTWNMPHNRDLFFEKWPELKS